MKGLRLQWDNAWEVWEGNNLIAIAGDRSEDKSYDRDALESGMTIMRVPDGVPMEGAPFEPEGFILAEPEDVPNLARLGFEVVPIDLDDVIAYLEEILERAAFHKPRVLDEGEGFLKVVGRAVIGPDGRPDKLPEPYELLAEEPDGAEEVAYQVVRDPIRTVILWGWI